MERKEFTILPLSEISKNEVEQRIHICNGYCIPQSGPNLERAFDVSIGGTFPVEREISNDNPTE